MILMVKKLLELFMNFKKQIRIEKVILKKETNYMLYVNI